MNQGTQQHSDDIAYPSSIGFVLIHVGCFAAFWTGLTWRAVVLAIVLYLVRIFAIGAGYHRYFAHRAFRTGRVFQFCLAFLAQTSAQRGVLWWAAKHRQHHRYSDTDLDVHSPVQRGFLYCPCRLDLRAAERRDRLCGGARPRPIQGAGVARSATLSAGGGARGGDMADRRLAGTGRRVLLEHRRALARDLLHQLARPRRRSPALRDRRSVEEQLAAGAADDG